MSRVLQAWLALGVVGAVAGAAAARQSEWQSIAKASVFGFSAGLASPVVFVWCATHATYGYG